MAAADVICVGETCPGKSSVRRRPGKPGEFEPCEPGNVTAADKNLEEVDGEDERHDDRQCDHGAEHETRVGRGKGGQGASGFHVAAECEDETQSHVNRLFEILSHLEENNQH